MQSPFMNASLDIDKACKRKRAQAYASTLRRRNVPAFLTACLLLTAGTSGWCQETRDPLLDLMIQKGILTQDEARKVKAEADAIRTNAMNQATAPADFKWKIGKAIKNIE